MRKINNLVNWKKVMTALVLKKIVEYKKEDSNDSFFFFKKETKMTKKEKRDLNKLECLSHMFVYILKLTELFKLVKIKSNEAYLWLLKTILPEEKQNIWRFNWFVLSSLLVLRGWTGNSLKFIISNLPYLSVLTPKFFYSYTDACSQSCHWWQDAKFKVLKIALFFSEQSEQKVEL